VYDEAADKVSGPTLSVSCFDNVEVLAPARARDDLSSDEQHVAQSQSIDQRAEQRLLAAALVNRFAARLVKREEVEEFLECDAAGMSLWRRARMRDAVPCSDVDVPLLLMVLQLGLLV
jgi:hypothetical protein